MFILIRDRCRNSARTPKLWDEADIDQFADQLDQCLGHDDGRQHRNRARHRECQRQHHQRIAGGAAECNGPTGRRIEPEPLGDEPTEQRSRHGKGDIDRKHLQGGSRRRSQLRHYGGNDNEQNQRCRRYRQQPKRGGHAIPGPAARRPKKLGSWKFCVDGPGLNVLLG